MNKTIIFTLIAIILTLGISFAQVSWLETTQSDFADGYIDPNLYASFRLNLEAGTDSGAVEWFARFDIDIDGYPDFVSPDLYSPFMLRVWYMRPARTYDSLFLPNGNAGGDCDIADLNIDGYPELIHSGFRSRVATIYWNGPSGLSETDTTLLYNYGAEAIYVADLDKDGFLDILIAGGDDDGVLRIYWGQPGFKYDTTSFSDIPISNTLAHNIECVDVDDDNDLDIALVSIRNPAGYLLLQNLGGRAFMADSSTLSIGHAIGGPHGASAGDLDKDGDIDLVFTGYGGVRYSEIFLNEGDWIFNKHTVNPGPCYGGSALHDFDDDGYLDIVYFRTGGYLTIYYNDGAGYFSDTDSHLVATTTSLQASGGTIIDVDLDGYDDIFVNNQSSYSYIFWGPDFNTKLSLKVSTDHHGVFREPGNINNKTPMGIYESSIFDSGFRFGFCDGDVSWIAYDERDYRGGGALPKPLGSEVKILARSGNSPMPNATWTDWDTLTDDSLLPLSIMGNRYLQYRAELWYTNPAYLPWLERIEFNLEPCEPCSAFVDSVWFTEETDCDSTNIVQICYELSSNCHDNPFLVTASISTDSGGTWVYRGTDWFVTFYDTTGNIGESVLPGTHCFRWDLGEDLPDIEGDSLLIKINSTAELAIPELRFPIFAYTVGDWEIYARKWDYPTPGPAVKIIDTTPDTIVRVEPLNFDNDNDLDIAIAMKDGSVRIFENAGNDTTFTELWRYYAMPDFQHGNIGGSTRTGDICSGFFDFDDYEDIACAQYIGTSTDTRDSLVILLGNGDGTFSPDKDTSFGWSTITGSMKMNLSCGDYDNDGISEIYNGSYQIGRTNNEVYKVDPAEDYSSEVLFLTGGCPIDVELTNFSTGYFTSLSKFSCVIGGGDDYEPGSYTIYNRVGPNWLCEGEAFDSNPFDETGNNKNGPSRIDNFDFDCDGFEEIVGISWFCRIETGSPEEGYLFIIDVDSDSFYPLINADTFDCPIGFRDAGAPERWDFITWTYDTLYDSSIAFGPLDSRPPRIDLTCLPDTVYAREIHDFHWTVEDSFWSNDLCSLFLSYCGIVETMTTTDTIITGWEVPTMTCDPACIRIAVRDSFCNWSYDSCCFLMLGDPDLWPDNLGISPTSPIDEGKPLTFFGWVFNDNVRNVGNDFDVCVLLNGENIGSITLHGLQTNDSDSVGWQGVLDEGDYEICFFADCDSEVTESDETNNVACTTFSVYGSECLIFPNPFTPNGDGTNDFAVFEYPYLYSESAELYIFDTRNRLVYHDNIGPVRDVSNYLNCSWNGRDNQKQPLPEGLYIYIIKENGQIVCNGTVVIAR